MAKRMTFCLNLKAADHPAVDIPQYSHWPLVHPSKATPSTLVNMKNVSALLRMGILADIARINSGNKNQGELLGLAVVSRVQRWLGGHKYTLLKDKKPGMH
jgi:hypothetical protein